MLDLLAIVDGSVGVVDKRARLVLRKVATNEHFIAINLAADVIQGQEPMTPFRLMDGAIPVHQNVTRPAGVMLDVNLIECVNEEGGFLYCACGGFHERTIAQS